MTTSPDELTGEARDEFDFWTSMGLGEAAAMRCVADAGLIAESDDVRDARTFERLGLSPDAAKVAAQGRQPIRPQRPAAPSRQDDLSEARTVELTGRPSPTPAGADDRRELAEWVRTASDVAMDLVEAFDAEGADRTDSVRRARRIMTTPKTSGRGLHYGSACRDDLDNRAYRRWLRV